MTAPFALPARCDMMAVQELLPRLAAASGSQVLDIDGRAVTQAGLSDILFEGNAA